MRDGVRPAVDVFVPNRDYSRYLPQCLDSVLGQEGVDVRVLVVDNASTDGSIEVAERYQERDARVSLLRHPEDRGLVTSLQEGLDWCRAEFALNLSADDQLTPGSLSRAVRLLEARPDLGFVYGPAVRHRDGAEPSHVRQYGSAHKVWAGQQWLHHTARTGKNPVFSPEVLLRTAPAQAVGYHHELPLCPDLGMWLGLAARAPVGHLRGARQALYRLHPSSMMHTQGWVAALEGRWRAYTLLVERDAAHVARPEQLLAEAARSLALEAVGTVELFTDWGRRGQLPDSDMLAFAQRLWPDVVASSAWRACERAQQRPRWSPVRLGHLVGHKAHSEAREFLRRQLGA